MPKQLAFCDYLIIKQFAFSVIIASATLLFPSFIFCQSLDLKFEQLTDVNGLSHNKVQCILQDKQGYLWFGTVYGLNRYDGYSFKVFENVLGDSSTIDNNNIISLYQDKSGIIWIGTSTIVASYNPQTQTFTNHNFSALQGPIHDFAEDENGTLFMATGSGLFSLNADRKKLIFNKTDETGKENIQGILVDPENKNVLWLSAETGIREYNIQSKEVKNYDIPVPVFEDISKEITHNIIEDGKGNIWTTTTNHGIYELNKASGIFTSYKINADKNATESKTSTRIMIDNDGKIWIGTEGLCIFDPLTKTFSFSKTGTDDNQGIAARTRAILKGRNGIYWIGTERGIAKYDPKLYSFTTIKANYPYTLQTANTIIEDREKTCWVGSYLGLGIVDPNTGNYKEANYVLGENNAVLYTSIPDNDGSMWFGSESALFHVYKNQNNNWISEKINLPVSGKIQVRSMVFDANHFLWTGTNGGGLFKLNPSAKTFVAYMGDAKKQTLFSSITIASLCFISTDSLLIGTKGLGVILMNTAKNEFTKIDLIKKEEIASIDNSIINAVYKDLRNNIWIGTDGGGLWKTGTGLSSFTNYSTRNGLQSTSISQITEDDKGQVWLNTSVGLEVIDPLNNRFVHYSAKDGLSINQQDYLLKRSSGDLIRVDYNGLHIFHSSSINLNKEVPPVYIYQMQILDKTIPIYKDTVIHLKYNENYLSFAYVALNYTQSFKNKYAYMLEGLDTKWVDAADRRFATYANIGPGTYTFHVKAANNNGIWNETGASITFIISQPWWNAWWFYTLAILIVAAVIYTIFQLKLQQKVKAMEMRNTISRDLHDEVGSTLSSIGFLSSMALNDADDSNQKILGTLNNINESSTRMLDVMNDIIWNIQPKNDTVKNIIARMVAFASDILEAKKIDLHISIADNLDHLHLGLTERHNFYMIYKEAINNLAKYSKATEAWVRLEFDHPYLLLDIKDNGKGFDPKNVRGDGNGLRNMRSRAEKIGASYQIQTVLNEGTTITVRLKAS